MFQFGIQFTLSVYLTFRLNLMFMIIEETKARRGLEGKIEWDDKGWGVCEEGREDGGESAP